MDLLIKIGSLTPNRLEMKLKNYFIIKQFPITFHGCIEYNLSQSVSCAVSRFDQLLGEYSFIPVPNGLPMLPPQLSYKTIVEKSRLNGDTHDLMYSVSNQLALEIG